MEEKILKQILDEVKKISAYISQKAKKEQLKNDLSCSSLDQPAADACKRVGDGSI